MSSKSIKLVFILGALFLTNSGYPQSIDKTQAQAIADKMVVFKKYHVTVNKILPPVNDIVVVLLDPPYREYPSVILIKKDKITKKWNRVFECLSPGIQNSPSGLLDLHTVKGGIDFEISDKKLYSLSDSKVMAFLSAAAAKGATVIPYQNFLHMFNLDGPPPTKFANYIIDKTIYYNLANKLYDGAYEKYPTNECIMYDSPKIKDVGFEYVGRQYVITVKTTNNQYWTYTFDGVDSKNQFLVNKKITVKKL